MLKNTSRILLLIFLFAVPASASNIGKNVYGIFTEMFSGVVMDDASTQDGTYFSDYWMQVSGGLSVYTAYDVNSGEEDIDGSFYYKITSSTRNVDGASYFGFLQGAQNMTDYIGGEIELWVRTAAANAKNVISFGIKASDGVERVNTIAVLNPSFESDNQWHKISIPLTKEYFGITDTQMTSVFSAIELTMLIKTSTWVQFDLDRIIWKKANQTVDGTSFSVKLKNRNDNNESDVIGWNSSASFEKQMPALQYLEIKLDYLDKSNWGIQIYTMNNTNSSDPRYASAITTGTISGLVEISGKNEMLPMYWRAAIDYFPDDGSYQYGDLFSQDGWNFWFPLRDMSDSSYYEHNDNIIILKPNGFHYLDFGSSAQQFRSLGADKKNKSVFSRGFQQCPQKIRIQNQFHIS